MSLKRKDLKPGDVFIYTDRPDALTQYRYVKPRSEGAPSKYSKATPSTGIDGFTAKRPVQLLWSLTTDPDLGEYCP